MIRTATDLNDDDAVKRDTKKIKKTKSQADRESDGRLVLSIPKSRLDAYPKEMLLEQLLDLSAYSRLLEKKLKMPVSTPIEDTGIAIVETHSSSSSSPAGSTQQRDVDALKSLLLKGIQRQMVWKSACKHGVSSLVFEGFANPQVFETLFPSLKKKKSLKIPSDDFPSILDRTEITQGIRYGMLVLKGESVTVSWNNILNQYKISAKYGKM